MANHKENIFSVLDKYNSASNENYLTESFVFVLNYLLCYERNLLIEFFNSVFKGMSELLFVETENISITTQSYFPDLGIPDIIIETENKIIIIEVKFDSGLGNLQIENYKNILYNSNKSIRKLVLLTRHLVDIPDEKEQPDIKLRWFNISDIFSKLKSKNETCNLFINSFNNFLERKKMSVKKVGWEFINGISSLINFASMLEISLNSKEYTKLVRSAGASYYGYYFYSGSQRYWTGIKYDNPLNFVLQIIDENGAIKKENFKNLEDDYYFSLDSDKQLLVLVNYIEELISSLKV